MRSVRMYLLRLDGEPHASATYRGSCSRAVSRTPFRSEVNRARRSWLELQRYMRLGQIVNLW